MLKATPSKAWTSCPFVPNPASQLGSCDCCKKPISIREEKERDRADYWKRMYHRVNQDYIALQLHDLCSDCQRQIEETENGGTVETCRECSHKKETVRTLTRRLEETKAVWLLAGLLRDGLATTR